MSERAINISLSKIYNYQEVNTSVHLSFAFYSKAASSMVTKKVTKAVCLNNCVNLAVNLRINYTEEQNIIIVVIEEFEIDSEFMKYVGEAEINLDELQDKKLKYYSVESTDKILQAEVYEPKKYRKTIEQQNESETFSTVKNRERFINDRKKFLQKIIDTDAQLKFNFQQKISQLLSDSKSVKMNKFSNTAASHQKDLIYENELDEMNESKLKKSRSDQALLNLRGRFSGKEKESGRQSKEKIFRFLNEQNEDYCQKISFKEKY